MFDVETRLPESRCSECGYEMDAASGSTQPAPGDYSLCINCGCLNIFADDLTLRAPTVDEIFEAQKCEQVQEARSALMAVVKARAEEG